MIWEANRAVRLRGAADVVADIMRPPALSAYPRARAVLEAHPDLAWARLTSVGEQTWGQISDELVFVLLADFTGEEATVNAVARSRDGRGQPRRARADLPVAAGRRAALAADRQALTPAGWGGYGC